MNKTKIIEILNSESDCCVSSEHGFAEGVEILYGYDIKVTKDFKSIYFCSIDKILEAGVTAYDIKGLRKIGWFYYERENAIATFI